MKYFLFLFAIILLSATAYGQDEQRMNNIILEVGGSSIPYTVGYERVVKSSESGDVRVKGGFGFYTTCDFCDVEDMVGSRGVAKILSLELLSLRGKKRSRFETGLGLGIVNDNRIFSTISGPLLSVRIGYRFVSINNGLNFGIGLNPTLHFASDTPTPYPYQRTGNRFIPFPGIKLGYGF